MPSQTFVVDVSRIESSLSMLLKGASIIFLGTVVGQIFGLVGQIIIVRSLSPEQFGTVALAFSIVSALSGILVFGTPQGTARLLAADQNAQRQREFIQSGLLVALLGGISGAILIFIFRFKIQQLTNTPYLGTVLSVFVIYFLISPVQHVLDGALRGLQRSTQRVLAKNVFGRIGAICLLVLLVLLQNPFTGAVVYWLSLPILISIASVYFLSGTFSASHFVKILPKRSSLVEMVTFSWPLALSTISTLLMTQMDILMLGYFLSPADVGLYRAVKPLKQVVLFFLTSFVFLYLPIATEYYTQGRLDDLDVLYTTATKWIVTATFPVVLTMVLFSSDIIRILFTDDYIPVSTAFTILMFGMFTRVIVGPNGATIQAINMPQVEMYAGLAGLITNLFLNAFLIPQLGIEGAALATTVSYMIFNGIEVLILYNETGIVPISRDVLAPLFPSMIVGVALILLIGKGESGIFIIGLCMVVLSVSQLIAVAVTKSVKPADLIILDQFENHTSVRFNWLRAVVRNQLEEKDKNDNEIK